MHSADKRIGLRGNDGIAVNFLACLGVFPDVIQSGKAKEHAILQLEVMPGKRRFRIMQLIRLVEAGGRDKAALGPERLPICGFTLNPFNPGIDGAEFDPIILGPEWD